MPTMHIEREGPEQAQDLVLLHGGIGTGRYHWSKLIEPLAASYHLHLPDLPGHGRTPPPDGVYGRDALVAAVDDLLAAFGHPVHVAGFSMGGHAALALAQTRPQYFASLMLIGVSVRDHDGLQGWRERFDPDRLASEYPLWAKQLARLHAPLDEGSNGDSARSWDGGRPAPVDENRAVHGIGAIHMSGQAWREVLRRDASGMDVEVDLGALSRLDCPVLLIRGDRDPAVDPAHYAELREIWPEAEECVVPAGGHDVQLTRAVVVEPVVLDFLDRHAVSS